MTSTDLDDNPYGINFGPPVLEAPELLWQSFLGALVSYRDDEGRPFGEGTAPRRYWEQVPMEMRTCPYAGTRHHHPLPMPEEGVGERFASAVGWPHASELALGAELIAIARGRCDLVLHGHRHVPSGSSQPGSPGRPLTVYNGGASTELGSFRLFTHERGRLLREPSWVHSGLRRRTPPWFVAALSELRGVFV